MSDENKPSKPDAEAAAPKQKSAPARRQSTSAPDRLSWKEQRELEALPERIATLEAEQKTLTARLEDPALYESPAEAQTVATRLAEIDTILLGLLERWESLESRLK